MTHISTRCLVSGADGHVAVTPKGRVVLTGTAPALHGEDLDRIADDIGADVALRTLAGNGGTAAIIAEADGRMSVMMTGRVATLIELPTANWFVTPTGVDGHTVGVPGDAVRFAVGLDASVPSDLTPNTAASLSVPDGQVASQVVIDLRVDAQPDPTPVGREVVDLLAAADFVPSPLPLASQEFTPPPQPRAADEAVAALPDAPPPPPPPPPPAATPGPGSDTAQSGAGGADESAGWVLGIRCPLDHHNHPDAGYCSQCGRKMGINATAVLVKGPRPPLGLFLLDDGGAIPVATNLLIGRDATTHPDVVAGSRQAVLLTDASNVVSRHHLAITLEEWTITVADLGSANGTMLIDARTGATQQLQTNVPVPMDAGDRLQIGPRVLQLELHHVAVPQ